MNSDRDMRHWHFLKSTGDQADSPVEGSKTALPPGRPMRLLLSTLKDLNQEPPYYHNHRIAPHLNSLPSLTITYKKLNTKGTKCTMENCSIACMHLYSHIGPTALMERRQLSPVPAVPHPYIQYSDTTLRLETMGPYTCTLLPEGQVQVKM